MSDADKRRTLQAAVDAAIAPGRRRYVGQRWVQQRVSFRLRGSGIEQRSSPRDAEPASPLSAARDGRATYTPGRHGRPGARRAADAVRRRRLTEEAWSWRRRRRHGRGRSKADAVTPGSHDPRDRRARHRARPHQGLRGQLPAEASTVGDFGKLVRPEAVQHQWRQAAARGARRLRRRRREDNEVLIVRDDPRRRLDQPRDGDFINEKESRGSTGQRLGAVSLPADAERATRAGTGRIADARADHRRYEGRRAHPGSGSY